ncbi:MAG: hypothetical protein JST89_02680 [Cyanobacteria bacterium SZAS-4]|nr:hypothetical protein [Cyanobacteria bacterium SZAS-4]
MQSKLFFSALLLCLSSMAPCHAQGGSPLPGNEGVAPMPGAELRPSAPAYPPENVQRLSAPAPVPQQTQAPTPGRKGSAAYGHLPLTVKDAKNRLVELRTAMAASGPSGLHDPIYQLSEWLADSADAHIKMAAAFSKHDDMKAQCAAEHQIGMKFSQLKRDAQLLKADLLIAQKRYPEALNPLVEIVLADPTSATGKTAYQRLKDLGFSHDAESAASTTAVTKPPAASADSAATETEAASSSTSVVQTSVKAAVKPVAGAVKPVATAVKPVVHPVARLVTKPIAHPISIAAKRRAH